MIKRIFDALLSTGPVEVVECLPASLENCMVSRPVLNKQLHCLPVPCHTHCLQRRTWPETMASKTTSTSGLGVAVTVYRAAFQAQTEVILCRINPVCRHLVTMGAVGVSSIRDFPSEIHPRLPVRLSLCVFAAQHIMRTKGLKGTYDSQNVFICKRSCGCCCNSRLTDGTTS